MSALEDALDLQFKAYRLPSPTREHRFHPERRWRFDFAWPDRKIAVEVEGGIWTGGAHTRGKHFISDCDKYNAATLAGWKILRVTANHIRSGSAVDMIRQAIIS